MPALLFSVRSHNGAQQKLEHALQVAPPAHTANTLIMPTALFNEPVFEGPDARTLRNGVWHRPASSTPDKGGNTVFAGHRFTYTDPEGSFYHLDKLKIGDPLGLVWEDHLYRYTVQQVRVVGPNETAIEAPTVQPQLTLYTCTPLTLPKDRLVVIATPTTTVEHHER